RPGSERSVRCAAGSGCDRAHDSPRTRALIPPTPGRAFLLSNSFQFLKIRASEPPDTSLPTPHSLSCTSSEGASAEATIHRASTTGEEAAHGDSAPSLQRGLPAAPDRALLVCDVPARRLRPRTGRQALGRERRREERRALGRQDLPRRRLYSGGPVDRR